MYHNGLVSDLHLPARRLFNVFPPQKTGPLEPRGLSSVLHALAVGCTRYGIGASVQATPSVASPHHRRFQGLGGGIIKEVFSSRSLFYLCSRSLIAMLSVCFVCLGSSFSLSALFRNDLVFFGVFQVAEAGAVN